MIAFNNLADSESKYHNFLTNTQVHWNTKVLTGSKHSYYANRVYSLNGR